MQQDFNPTEISLDFKVPVVVSDVQLIAGKTDGSVNLLFLQMNRFNEPVADVVAAIRMKDLEELKGLRRAIDEHIEKEETKED